MLRIVLAVALCTATAALAQDLPKHVTTAPVVEKQPRPTFKQCVRPALGEHLAVTVKLKVTAEGLPEDIAVDTSSSEDCLDQSAVAVVSQYRFRPATKDGQPIASQVRIEVSFERARKNY